MRRVKFVSTSPSRFSFQGALNSVELLTAIFSAASDSDVEVIHKHVEVGLQDVGRGEVLEIFVIRRGEIIEELSVLQG